MLREIRLLLKGKGLDGMISSQGFSMISWGLRLMGLKGQDGKSEDK